MVEDGPSRRPHWHRGLSPAPKPSALSPEGNMHPSCFDSLLQNRWDSCFLFSLSVRLLFLFPVRLLNTWNSRPQYCFMFQVKCKHLSHSLYQQEERSNGLWRGKGYLLSAQSLLSGQSWIHFLPLTDLFAYLIFSRLYYRAPTVMGLNKPALPITHYPRPSTSANSSTMNRRQPISWDQELQEHVL